MCFGCLLRIRGAMNFITPRGGFFLDYVRDANRDWLLLCALAYWVILGVRVVTLFKCEYCTAESEICLMEYPRRFGEGVA